MTRAAALAECEAVVRRADPDRYLAALFAPAAKRPALYALYAFNHELARIGGTARDPFAAEIRLQWWRDALWAGHEGRPPAHPVAVGLAEIVSSHPDQVAELEALIDARVTESSTEPFPTLAAMESHARATSARLMRIAASIAAGTRERAGIDAAGTAYGLAGLLRSARFHVSQGKVFLPADLLAAQQLSPADIVAGKNRPILKPVFDQIGMRAMDHFRQARRTPIPKAVMSAVLPASLVPAYLSRLTRVVDPLRDGIDISGLCRQLVMLRAAVLGRL